MAVPAATPIENRSEFILLFDVINGNPNGDPDAGNQPRVDPETGFGLVTDVCLKRKIRNFVALTKGYEPPYDIYIKDRGILAQEQRRAYTALGLSASDRPNIDARQWMCNNYFDIRTFGAVMVTGRAASNDKDNEITSMRGRKTAKLWNCGQVRGPVQIGFAQSQSVINPIENVITRIALTNPGDTGIDFTDDQTATSGQMGRKHTVPYGLYRAHGFISPHLARDTGFSLSDRDLLFEALSNLFEFDRSAARAEMAVKGLYLFEHNCGLGNAPAHKLFDMVRIQGPSIPRTFAEYEVILPSPNELPSGVSLKILV